MKEEERLKPVDAIGKKKKIILWGWARKGCGCGSKGRAGSTQPRLPASWREAGEEKVTMTPKRLTAAHVLPLGSHRFLLCGWDECYSAHFPVLETQVPETDSSESCRVMSKPQPLILWFFFLLLLFFFLVWVGGLKAVEGMEERWTKKMGNKDKSITEQFGAVKCIQKNKVEKKWRDGCFFFFFLLLLSKLITCTVTLFMHLLSVHIFPHSIL